MSRDDHNGGCALSDIVWGDVVADADGVLEVEGRLGDDDVLVRRYREPAGRGVIDALALLVEHGGALPDGVLGFGPDWICWAVPDPFSLPERDDVDILSASAEDR